MEAFQRALAGGRGQGLAFVVEACGQRTDGCYPPAAENTTEWQEATWALSAVLSVDKAVSMAVRPCARNKTAEQGVIRPTAGNCSATKQDTITLTVLPCNRAKQLRCSDVTRAQKAIGLATLLGWQAGPFTLCPFHPCCPGRNRSPM